MTAPRRTAARRLAVLAAALALAPGCRSREGSTASGGGGARPDPLVAGPGRIPRQNIPVPERGGTAGNKNRADPLLGSPVGKSGDRIGYSSDPERWKGGPYVPGPRGTPAALAALAKDDGFGLKIESADGGTPLTPAGGSAGPASGVPADVAPLLAELLRYGVAGNDHTTTRDGARYLFQARVPIGNGAVRGYTGAGATEADAVRQVLDQVRLDRGAK